MALSSRSKVLLVKSDAADGTPGTPAAADGILVVVDGFSFQPVAGDTVSRNLAQAYYGNSEELLINVHQVIEFETELQSSLALPADQASPAPPALAPLFLACGMSGATQERDDSDASIATGAPAYSFSPITGNGGSCTIHYYTDGQLHKMTNCRGTFSISVAANGIPRLRWRFLGKFVDPTSMANPAVDYARFLAPQVAQSGVTDLTLVSIAATQEAAADAAGSDTTAGAKHSYGAQPRLDAGKKFPVAAVSIDMNVDVGFRATITDAGSVVIGDRSPAGSLTWEALPLDDQTVGDKEAEPGDFNWPKIIKEGSYRWSVTLEHGTAPAQVGGDWAGAGKQVVVQLPRISLSSPQYQEDGNFLQVQASMQLLPTGTGNNEIKITMR